MMKKLYWGGWLLFAVLGVLALVKAAGITPGIERLLPGNVTELNDHWQTTVQDGTAEYRCTVPDEAEGRLRLCMKTYLAEFTLLLDDEPVYEFTDPYGLKGRSQHMLHLPEGAQGKTLILRTPCADPAEATAERLGNLYLGGEDEVFIRLFEDNVHALAFMIFTALLGGGMLAAAYCLRKSIAREIAWGLVHFGVFCLVAGIWVLTDSELLLFVTNRAAVIALVSFVSFMMMPTFLLRFLASILGKSRAFSVLCRLFCLVTVGYLVNYTVEAVPSYYLLAPTHLLIVCALVLVLWTGFRRMRDGGRGRREMRQIMWGFGLLSIFVLLALAVFIYNPVSQYARLYCVGIFLFMLCLMQAAITRLYGQMEESANVTAYRKLAYMDMMTGMENRTAFMEEQERDASAVGRAYLMFDINNLKQINDRCGHLAGDEVIVNAARCIQEVFGAIGKCYRIGGDEFVVILPNGANGEAEDGLARMRARVRRMNDENEILLDIAAGCAIQEDENETADQLFRRADARMYAEKQRMKQTALQNG